MQEGVLRGGNLNNECRMTNDEAYVSVHREWYLRMSTLAISSLNLRMLLHHENALFVWSQTEREKVRRAWRALVP